MGFSLILPQHLQAEGISRAPHPFDHQREQSWDVKVTEIFKVISVEKKKKKKIKKIVFISK